MKKIVAAALCLSLLLLSGCTQAEPPAPRPPEIPEERPLPPPDPVEELLQTMSAEEKVGQLFFVRCPEENAAADVQTYHLGGYLLFRRDFKDQSASRIIRTLQSYQDAAEIPLLLGVDEEGGTVVRVSANPGLRERKFDSPQKLYAQGGMEKVLEETREKDALLKALGINVNLAPVADVSTAAQDFIYDRSFGRSAHETAQYTAAVARQMADDGMGSVLKHFPGYGNNVDTHTGVAVDSRPIETFRESDLLPFASGLEGGGARCAVLVSHNIVECMDAGLPASLSPAVHQLLRKELGFEGVIMTDDLAMDAVQAYSADGTAAVKALCAGNDLVISSDYRSEIPRTVEAVNDGTLPMEIVDGACRRVLRWKAALGLI